MSTKTYKQPTAPDVETEEFEEDEPETDAGSYAPPIPVRRQSRRQPPVASPPTTTTSPQTEPGRKRRVSLSRPARFMLLGVVIIIVSLVVENSFIVPAWNWSQDQWHYGDARITQMDANVGHGGESHFIATFSHGDVVIIEISLSNPMKNNIYTLTGFMGETSTPIITLTVQDVNRDGKPDLLIQIEGSGYQTVLYNTGSGFSTNEGRS